MSLRNNKKIYILLGIIIFTILVSIYFANKIPNTQVENKMKIEVDECLKTSSVVYATSSEIKNIYYPSRFGEAEIILDKNSAVQGDSIAGEINFVNLGDGCKNVNLHFFTNSTSSTVHLVMQDSKGNKMDIPVIITNEINIHKISKLPDEVFTLIKNFIDDWWDPNIVVTDGIGAISKSLYVVNLTDHFLNYRNMVKKNNEQPNKLLIIESDNSGKYFIAASSDTVLLCGTCGGVNFVNPIDSIQYINNKNIIRISTYGGTSWRWSGERDIEKIKGKWYVVRDYNFATNLNNFANEKEITEENYMIPLDEWKEEGNKFLSSKKYISPGEFDDNLPKSSREIALDNYKNFPSEYATTTYDGLLYTVVPYRESFSKHQFKNFPNENNNTEEGKKLSMRSGVFVMKDGQIVWESKELFGSVDANGTQFQDIDNDRIAELVISDRGSLNGSRCDIYIYKFENGSFNKIQPKIRSEGNYGCYAYQYNFVDTNKDGVFEIK